MNKDKVTCGIGSIYDQRQQITKVPTAAEKALNQKCKKRALNCCSWLYSASTADMKEDAPRYVAMTEGAYW